MSKRYKIGIDIDDTITNIKEELENAALKYALELGKTNIRDITNIIDDNNGNIYQEKYGFNYEELKYFLKDIQESIIQKAMPRKNAKESIRKLKELGHKIYIITARDYEFHDDPYKLSKEWLDKNDIEYDKLIVNARQKAGICLEEGIEIFIDDKKTNCIEVSNVGIKVIRISDDNTYNENFATFKDWNAIYKYIIGWKTDEKV